MNWVLLVLFAVVLAAICASNIWLRYHGDSENEAQSDSDIHTDSTDP